MAFAAISKDAVREFDVLWITAGLGCDGATIAMTAATQPSIEDVLLGASSLDSKKLSYIICSSERRRFSENLPRCRGRKDQKFHSGGRRAVPERTQ
jgi:hypothetical protein